MSPPAGLVGAEIIIHEVEIFIGVFIGAITFTGSIVAYGKLAGWIDGKAIALPGRNALNVAMVLTSFYLGYMYLDHAGPWTLYLMTAIALFFGIHMVMAIGGADMPVVVSMLNSYSDGLRQQGFCWAMICLLSQALSRRFWGNPLLHHV